MRVGGSGAVTGAGESFFGDVLHDLLVTPDDELQRQRHRVRSA